MSGSATYLMKPMMELIAEPTMMPASTSMMFELLRKSTGSVNASPTAIMPPRKANSWMKPACSDSSIASAAPTQAPLETPRKSGEIRGLQKIP